MVEWYPNGVQWQETWKDAAVLLPRYIHEGEDSMVLTKRSQQVALHKGQICFPGGTFEEGDEGLWKTALRESQEELGLDPQHVLYEQALSRQYSPTGFCITPFVGVIKSPQSWSPNEAEIEEILIIPLTHLKENFRFVQREMFGHEYWDPEFAFENNTIWGVTGRMLCEFLGLKPERDLEA